MNKYGNKKVTVDGIIFDSVKEANRWQELLLLQRAGEITYLERQVRFVLIPSQKKDGKVVERPVVYIADFKYWDNRTGEQVVEDTKGFRTKEYIIKRKLLLYRFGLRIKEV